LDEFIEIEGLIDQRNTLLSQEVFLFAHTCDACRTKDHWCRIGGRIHLELLQQYEPIFMLAELDIQNDEIRGNGRRTVSRQTISEEATMGAGVNLQSRRALLKQFAPHYREASSP
jgi:hypothetical protein